MINGQSNYDNHHFMLEYLDSCDGTDILEFGVYSGQSLYSILKKCNEADIKTRRVFGFDSFCGLRIEKSDVDIPEEWFDGAFDARELFKVDKPEQVANMLVNIFRSRGFDIELIVGTFNKLNKESVKIYNIEPAFYINIDCDLYSSTRDALNFIFDNNLLAVNGLIRYDDYNSVKIGGEQLAHKELVEERGLIFEYLDYCVFKYRGAQ